MSLLKPYLNTALEAVRQAEKVINKYYSNEVRYTLKSDQSPVSIADQEAEEVIKQVIHSQFPNHTFIGEESFHNLDTSDYTWIIDPIDGTNNYLRRIPVFATQLALYHLGEILVGVSNAPQLGETMSAARSKGAYMNGVPLHVSGVNDFSKAYACYGSLRKFADVNLVDKLTAYCRQARAARGFGDFWNYHLLAQGKVDCVVEGGVKIWDIAALNLIITEAGGKMTDLQGLPISLQSTSAVATNNLLHSEIIGHFTNQ